METLPYCHSDSDVNMARPRFEIFHKDRTFEVNKFFIYIWRFGLVLQARNRPVGITGE